jgi:hypothetical protein
METNTLCNRHIGPDESDVKKILEKIGVHSLDELINQVIPADIRLKEPIELPEPLTEYAYGKHMAELAAKNKLYATYIGMGWYNTITPAVIQRNVFENPVWYTSYTPYQAEISQGLHTTHRFPGRSAFRYAGRLPGEETDVSHREGCQRHAPQNAPWRSHYEESEGVCRRRASARRSEPEGN